MRDDAGLAEPADDAMGHVARALGRAARQHQHVAGLQRLAHRGFELRLVVGDGAEKHRLAAVLRDRRRDDRAVGVVDRGRAQRLAGLHQFVAGGDDGDARPARDGDLRDAAGRQHADLARADDGAGAQQRLAAGDIGAGIGHELPGGSGAADFDRARSRRLRVLDHHDGVRPARHRTAGRDRRGRSRQYRPRRRGAAGDHLVVQHHAHRRRLAGGSEIGGTHRKAVDIGAVERRHVDRRHDVLGERAAERVGERALLARHRARKQGGFETRQRILARQDRQELVLLVLSRSFGEGVLVIPELISVPQHIGIDRAACRKSFRAA